MGIFTSQKWSQFRKWYTITRWAMVSLVKLALETGHFFYCLIVALTLSQNLRRWSAYDPIEKKWLDSLAAVLQTLGNLFQLQYRPIHWVQLNSISTGSSSIHWDYWGRVFDKSHLILRSIVMTKFRTGIVNELAIVETWSLVDDCALMAC